jgi:hypothetical protein
VRTVSTVCGHFVRRSGRRPSRPVGHIHPCTPAVDGFHDRLPPVVVKAVHRFDAGRAMPRACSDAVASRLGSGCEGLGIWLT